MKSNLHDIEVLFQHQTDAAVCVRETEDGEDIWIPKSRCEIYPQTPVRGQYVVLTSDEAMLTEKGDGLMRPFGGSPRTATAVSWPCMSGTTAPTSMRMAGCAACLRVRERKSSCAPVAVTPDLFGGTSSATAESEASTALSSETKARTYRPSLSDKLTLSLMRSGLVAGITPTSTRRACGAPIPATASNWLAGKDAE